MTTPREVALAFIERIAAAEVEALASLLAEDLEFRGPLLEADSSVDYLDALRHDPLEPGGFRVSEVDGAGDEVTVRWTYIKPDAALEIEQWFEVKDGRIRRTRLSF